MSSQMGMMVMMMMVIVMRMTMMRLVLMHTKVSLITKGACGDPRSCAL